MFSTKVLKSALASISRRTCALILKRDGKGLWGIRQLNFYHKEIHAFSRPSRRYFPTKLLLLSNKSVLQPMARLCHGIGPLWPLSYAVKGIILVVH